MLKKITIIGLLLFCAACSTTEDNSKTPPTLRGQLNSCMMNKTYDADQAGTLADGDKWSIARDIMQSCKRSLHISGAEINDTQSLNIVVSLIDCLTAEKK